MKAKAILTFLLFFIGTPLLLGQSSIPTLPGEFSTPTLPSVPSPTNISSLPLIPSSIPLNSLQEAGINTNSLNASSVPTDLSRFQNQGVFGQDSAVVLPTGSDSAAALGREFAQKTFPEEFNAAQGELPRISSLSTPNLSTPNLSTPNLSTPNLSTPTSL